LLAHCRGEPSAVDQPVRVRWQLRCRADRGRGQRAAQRQAGAAGGERLALPRASALEAALARSLRPRPTAGAGRRRAIVSAASERATDGQAAAPCADASLDALRRVIPAAAALPLLLALAQGSRREVHLDYLPGLGLRVDVEPASSLALVDAA
jgi:type IV secretory pathway VirJ component